MKTTAIVCTVLAGTLGFGTLASAQQIREQRAEQRHERQLQRQQRQLERQQRQLEQQREALRLNNAVRRGVVPGYAIGGGITNTQENCERYWNCATVNGGTVVVPQQFYRGGYLPSTYLQPNYYVSNWNAYPGLYAPPAGYQWVNVGPNYMLVSMANGVIANLLTQ